MKNFDDMIKKQAKSEPIITPVGFEERMDGLTANLPNKKVAKTKRTALRILLVAAVILIPTTVGVFATDVGANMTNGVINYFNAPHEFKYLSKQAAYEEYNSEVGVSTTDQGITLTVDNIAVDDNYINIFYTLHNPTPIKLAGDENDLEQWRLNWTAPYFFFKANGHYIEPPAQGEVEAYLADAYTLKGMQRFAVMDTLDDRVDLELYTEKIFNTKGQWHIPVSVDKSSVAVVSLTVNPNIKARVTTGWNKEFPHNITVEKVSISPFGNQIVLSERAENTFTQFTLRDEKGRYLTVIPGGTYGGNVLRKATNRFEFIGGRTDMTEITIIPIVTGDDNDGQPAPDMVAVEIGTYPISMPVSELGGFVLDSLEITAEKAVARFHQEGAVQIITPNLMLLDENGEYLDFAEFQDNDYDRATGEIIITQTFRNVSEKDLDRIKKVGYFTRTQRLNEDEAITIRLK